MVIKHSPFSNHNNDADYNQYFIYYSSTHYPHYSHWLYYYFPLALYYSHIPIHYIISTLSPLFIIITRYPLSWYSHYHYSHWNPISHYNIIIIIIHYHYHYHEPTIIIITIIDQYIPIHSSSPRCNTKTLWSSQPRDPSAWAWNTQSPSTIQKGNLTKNGDIMGVYLENIFIVYLYIWAILICKGNILDGGQE